MATGTSDAWGAPTSWEVVCRRSAGRRRYNAGRKFLRNLRRAKIFWRLAGTGALQDARRFRGVQALLARELGVSPATISRDLRALRDPAHQMPRLGTWPPHLDPAKA
jgi:hypothetical protein